MIGITHTTDRVTQINEANGRRISYRPRTGLGSRTWKGLRRNLGLAALLVVTTSCQLNAFSPQQDVEMGLQSYDQILENERVITSGSDVRMVNQIMDRLVAAAAAEKPELVDLFQWEVRLLDNDEMVNAFCLPGGKMAVYTGILPVAGGETGLAVVMGHEIAHALERHGTEAVTRQMGASTIIEILVGQDYQGLANLGANLVGLKFGRGAELEADRSGLRYMARAGYDPREAAAFWGRMSAGGGDAPPEWLSTHPSGDSRIEQIESLLPEAMELYEASRGLR
ncbi:MAG: M48 family metallopeptidase [Planctomycetota bacterium]|nr:M48 family metallopeptidase [Planctomycetota bacterium]